MNKVSSFILVFTISIFALPANAHANTTPNVGESTLHNIDISGDKPCSNPEMSSADRGASTTLPGEDTSESSGTITQ